MGETLGRRENMASPGTRGKSVGVVLAEAEYINNKKCNYFQPGQVLAPPARLSIQHGSEISVEENTSDDSFNSFIKNNITLPYYCMLHL